MACPRGSRRSSPPPDPLALDSGAVHRERIVSLRARLEVGSLRIQNHREVMPLLTCSLGGSEAALIPEAPICNFLTEGRDKGRIRHFLRTKEESVVFSLRG